MKLSAKPISSPGRAEKYPPPLMMRFLRSNVGSRSRGRSRSSPMFVLRKKNAATTIEAQQEPTSPKVTCMGQVRVRRSKQTGSRPGRPGKTGASSAAFSTSKRRCKWIRKALFCHRFTWKHKRHSFKSTFRKWVLFFRVGSRRKSKIGEESSRYGSKFGGEREENKRENQEVDNEEDEEEEEEGKVFVSTSSSPPKNALSLMRSRSAPYRSSSLACRFWGSPLNNNNEETEQEQRETEQQNPAKDKEDEEEEEEENPTSGTESKCRDSDPETDTKMGYFKEFDGSNSIKERFVNKKSANIVSIEELKKQQTGDLETTNSVRPLILTRCKSEPARTGVKLDPQLSYWKRRRLGFT